MTTHALGATTAAPKLLRIAEDELQRLRGQLASAAAFIHDPTHDLSARQALAGLLHLPQPAIPGRAAPAAQSNDAMPERPPTAELTLPVSRKDSERVLAREGTR